MPREIARLVDGKVTERPNAEVIPEIVGRSGSDIRVYSEPGFDRYEYGVKRKQTFLEKIRDEKPDYVVLQAVANFAMSDDPKPNGKAHLEALTRYCEAVRAAGGEPVIYEMGWHDSDRTAEGRQRILKLAKASRVQIYVPCSTAWARVYREKPELALQHPMDRAHPGDFGHFLNLACFYAALTDQSPVGRLPREFHVWPHALGSRKLAEQQKQAEDIRLAQFEPDDYQAKLPKWMWKNMAHGLSAKISDMDAKYLEGIAWEEWQKVHK